MAGLAVMWVPISKGRAIIHKAHMEGMAAVPHLEPMEDTAVDVAGVEATEGVIKDVDGI